MSCLVKTDFRGTIAWLGRVSTPENNIRSESLTSAEVSFEGIIGEAHFGATRPSCVRVTMLYPKGTEIRVSSQSCPQRKMPKLQRVLA